jgi:hypothetical protein
MNMVDLDEAEEGRCNVLFIILGYMIDQLVPGLYQSLPKPRIWGLERGQATAIYQGGNVIT